jgi:hypothetical protein
MLSRELGMYLILKSRTLQILVIILQSWQVLYLLYLQQILKFINARRKLSQDVSLLVYTYKLVRPHSPPSLISKIFPLVNIFSFCVFFAFIYFRLHLFSQLNFNFFNLTSIFSPLSFLFTFSFTFLLFLSASFFLSSIDIGQYFHPPPLRGMGHIYQ